MAFGRGSCRLCTDMWTDLRLILYNKSKGNCFNIDIVLTVDQINGKCLESGFKWQTFCFTQEFQEFIQKQKQTLFVCVLKAFKCSSKTVLFEVRLEKQESKRLNAYTKGGKVPLNRKSMLIRVSNECIYVTSVLISIFQWKWKSDNNYVLVFNSLQ